MAKSPEQCDTLSFLSWDVGGLNSLLLNTDCVNFITNYDIVSLQETWLIDADHYKSEFSEYTMFMCKAIESDKGGRNMGGVIVLVKNTIVRYVNRICEFFENGVLLNIDKSMFGSSSDVLYVALYIPPDSSPGVRGSTDSVLQTLESCIVSEERIGENLIINGDLNARTANEPDYLCNNDIQGIPELQDIADIIDTGVDDIRHSKDTVLNKKGREL